METVRACMIAIAGMLLAVQFKDGKTAYGCYLTFATSLLLFFLALDRVRSMFDVLREFIGVLTGYGYYLTLLLKMLGITYVAEFSSAVCKDAGYHAIASQIEIVARLSMLGLSMPVILTLLHTIQNFLK